MKKPEVTCAMCGQETEASIACRESKFWIPLNVQRVKLEYMGHLYDPCGPWKGITFDFCDVCFGKVLAFLHESGVKFKGWPVRLDGVASNDGVMF